MANKYEVGATKLFTFLMICPKISVLKRAFKYRCLGIPSDDS
jgi:hypothetical protein